MLPQAHNNWQPTYISTNNSKYMSHELRLEGSLNSRKPVNHKRNQTRGWGVARSNSRTRRTGFILRDVYAWYEILASPGMEICANSHPAILRTPSIMHDAQKYFRRNGGKREDPFRARKGQCPRFPDGGDKAFAWIKWNTARDSLIEEWPGHWLSWLKFSWFSSAPPGKCRRRYFNLSHDHFFRSSFLISLHLSP